MVLLGRPVDSRLGFEPESVFATSARLCLPVLTFVQGGTGAGENPRPNHNQGECSMKDGEKSSTCRYIALDIHKHYSVVAGVDREGQEVLPPCRVEHLNLEEWLGKHLLPSDRVVIESTTNAWHVYDLLEPLVAEVLVANPITSSRCPSGR